MRFCDGKTLAKFSILIANQSNNSSDGL